MSDDSPEKAESDDFEETRMSIGEHLEEMRSHLIRALLWLAVIMTICLQFQEKILEIATWPHRKTMLAIVEANQYDKIRDLLPSDELEAVQEVINRKNSLAIAHDDLLRNNELLKRKFADLGDGDLQDLSRRQQKIIDEILALSEKQKELLAQNNKDLTQFTLLQNEVIAKTKEFKQVEAETVQAERLIDRRAKRANVKVRLQQLSYPEAFMSYLKVSFVLALFIAGPFMGREAWKFVGKGLYPEEKRWVTVISPLSFIAFFSGAAFGYFILIPLGLHYLATYGGEDIIEGSITLSEYLSIFITLTLVVGLFFQLPLLMSFTTLIHLTTDQTFREKRRWFYFVAVIVSAFLTPPDPVTQVLMWIPLLILYELGIWLSFVIVRGRAKDTDIPPSPNDPPASGPDDSGPDNSDPVIDSSGPAALTTEAATETDGNESREDQPPHAPEDGEKGAASQEAESSDTAESTSSEGKDNALNQAEADEAATGDEDSKSPEDKDREEATRSDSSPENEDKELEATTNSDATDSDSNWEDEVYPEEWYEELEEDEEYLEADGYQGLESVDSEANILPPNLLEKAKAEAIQTPEVVADSDPNPDTSASKTQDTALEEATQSETNSAPSGAVSTESDTGLNESPKSEPESAAQDSGKPELAAESRSDKTQVESPDEASSKDPEKEKGDS